MSVEHFGRPRGSWKADLLRRLSSGEGTPCGVHDFHQIPRPPSGLGLVFCVKRVGGNLLREVIRGFVIVAIRVVDDHEHRCS